MVLLNKSFRQIRDTKFPSESKIGNLLNLDCLIIVFVWFAGSSSESPKSGKWKHKLVGVQRVVKVTKGGRAFGFSAIVVVGDENSIVGIGLGKSKDVSTAIAKAIDSAKKNLVKLPIYKGTLPHEQFAKFGGAKVLIKPASNGTGVKAGGAMRSVLESAGVKDVLAKSKGSSNPHNLVKATMLALLQLRDPLTVSRNRGIKMEKAFNG